MTIPAVKKQTNPAIATVVNLGVSFLHLRLTENTENPIEEIIPKIKPITEFFSVLSKAIISMPTVAMKIDIHTFKVIFSFKNKKANNAVKKGLWCSTDPVCNEVVPQGPFNLNLGACYSCALLPETSCELINSLLDRGIVVGTQMEPDLGIIKGIN